MASVPTTFRPAPKERAIERHEAPTAPAGADASKAVLDAMHAGVGVLTPEGVLLEANRKLCEAAGGDAADLLGRPLWKGPWWRDEPALRERVRAAIACAAAGAAQRFDVPCRLHERQVVAELSITPLRDATGRVARLVLTGMDVSARQRLEQALAEREARLELALAAAGMHLWTLDVDADAFESIEAGAGGASELVPFEQGFDGVHPDDAARCKAELRRAIARGTDYDVTYRLRDPKGALRWMRTVARRVDRAGPTGRRLMVGIGQDITAQREAEAALRDSESRFRLLADNISQFAWIADADGTIRWFNRRWYDYTGMRPEDVAGSGWQQVHHPDHALRVGERFRAAIQAGQVWEDTFPLRGGDGQWRWFLSRAEPERDADGRIVRWFGTNTDITELRQATQALADSEERFRLAVESSELGTWDLDPKTMRVRWSESARRMFGIEGKEFVALADPVSRMHPDDRDRVQGAITDALDPAGSGDYRAQYRVVWPDGTVRWLDMVGLAKFEGEGDARYPARFAGLLWDVTEQQRLIESLREADARKDEFLAMLAHELRNPLAPLTNALRLLERTESLSPAGRTALAMADRQRRQMQRLVDDLLEVGRITRGKIALRPVPMLVASAVYDAVEAVNPAIEAHGHTLTVHLPATPSRIVADPARVAQVLQNLLNNACKYTPDGGRIRVDVEDADDAVEIRVADDGDGIAPDHLERIFDLFTQADATYDRAAGGLGIGLALVKRLVELHGGTVRADSPGKGKGATFTVRLPRGAAP